MYKTLIYCVETLLKGPQFDQCEHLQHSQCLLKPKLDGSLPLFLNNLSYKIILLWLLLHCSSMTICSPLVKKFKLCGVENLQEQAFCIYSIDNCCLFIFVAGL
ncbi:hypothetical protein AcV7_005984 [Taiwanofungus camphoratus]|nr:hypothetical protein AcV7_005984 [Antrodia cinnamomea]